MIRGIVVSDGVAIGRVVSKKEVRTKIEWRAIDDEAKEIERFNNAVYKYSTQLEKTYKKTLNIMGEEEAEIYKNHMTVLKDSVIIGGVKKSISEKKCNAEFVLDEVKNKYEAIYKRMDDDNLKKKAEFIKNITDGIIKELSGIKEIGMIEIEGQAIIIAKELVATDTMDLDKAKILGIVTETGGKTSHAAVLAKTWGIPCVIGVKKLMTLVQEGDYLIVDANKGEIVLNPTQEVIDYYHERMYREKELEKIYTEFKDREAITKDDYFLDISGAVSSVEEINVAIKNGASQIGLFRTEFLFVGRPKAPSEAEQFDVYKEAVVEANGLTVTFRILDCGAENDMPYVYMPEELNPALGYRSIRMLLNERELLHTQFKALLRASNFGNIRILIPMLSSLDELLDVKLVLEDAKISLEEEGGSYASNIEIGVLIEVPAAAMIVDFFAQEVNFIYIGANDFVQYVTATDKSNEHIFELYDEYHPGVLRLIQETIQKAHREGTSVTIMGEVTGNELLLDTFMGMGVDSLCLSSAYIPKAKWEICQTTKAYWENVAESIGKMSSGKVVKSYLEKKYGNEYIWKSK